MLKKLMTIVGVFAVVLLLGASSATAYQGYFGPVSPRTPSYDGYARAGGAFPSMSYYMTGLRGGVVTDPWQSHGLRTGFSAHKYPAVRHSYGRPRVGGSYYDNIHGITGVKSAMLGDFRFNGGTRLGNGAIIS